MIQALLDFDKWLFLILNGLNNSTLDGIMVAISSKWMWIPLYIYLLYVLIRRFKMQSVYLIVLTALLITLCDQISVHLFKNVFMRLRPCHEPDLLGLVHTVKDHCGGQFGFVSSHATNVFGLAVFLGSVLKKASKHWMTFLIIWAIVVSYSRIYLGVHYPMDVIGGGLLGYSLAIIMLRFLQFLNNKYALKLIDK